MNPQGALLDQSVSIRLLPCMLNTESSNAADENDPGEDRCKQNEENIRALLLREAVIPDHLEKLHGECRIVLQAMHLRAENSELNSTIVGKEQKEENAPTAAPTATPTLTPTVLSERSSVFVVALVKTMTSHGCVQYLYCDGIFRADAPSEN